MKKEATIRELEKDYGVDFGVKRDMKLTTWLKKNGYNNIAKTLERIEKDLKANK